MVCAAAMAMSAEERKKAAKHFLMKKHLVPTRPHPNVPDKPSIFENALGLLVTPIDKLRDLFNKYPEQAELDAASAAAAARK